jgi:geranylgeranyl diphosphate synthase type II
MRMKAFSEMPVQPEDAQHVSEFLARVRNKVDHKLDELLPSESTEPQSIHQAIRWTIFAGGKRIRPALLFAAGEQFGASENPLTGPACAVELIHTYSLVHDDLPSMDNDDLRRGRATCHIKFGEATAILTGDVLQTLAFQILAEDEELEPDTRVRLISEIAGAAGTPAGMVAGQVLDLAAEGRVVSGDEIESIHKYKTGALIVAALRCGAIIGGASPEELECISEYGRNLGLLFQITDDLLDSTATAEDLGKTPGKDQQAQKATYPLIYGFEESRRLARESSARAIKAIEGMDRPSSLLKELVLMVERRRY